MLNVALFGPPGAGKGTQSERLVQEYDLFYISTGDLLRKEMAEKSALGEEARSIIASGGLVSDEIIVQIIEKRSPTIRRPTVSCSTGSEDLHPGLHLGGVDDQTEYVADLSY